tara:strand:- start:11082 stop:11339 length:258 start_codon:yes stop_codon:yes gene_type:complete
MAKDLSETAVILAQIFEEEKVAKYLAERVVREIRWHDFHYTGKGVAEMLMDASMLKNEALDYEATYFKILRFKENFSKVIAQLNS